MQALILWLAMRYITIIQTHLWYIKRLFSALPAYLPFCFDDRAQLDAKNIFRRANIFVAVANVAAILPN